MNLIPGKLYKIRTIANVGMSGPISYDKSILIPPDCVGDDRLKMSVLAPRDSIVMFIERDSRKNNIVLYLGSVYKIHEPYRSYVEFHAAQ